MKGSASDERERERERANWDTLKKILKYICDLRSCGAFSQNITLLHIFA